MQPWDRITASLVIGQYVPSYFEDLNCNIMKMCKSCEMPDYQMCTKDCRTALVVAADLPGM